MPKGFFSVFLLHSQLAAGTVRPLHRRNLFASLSPQPIDLFFLINGAKLVVVQVGILLVQLWF